MARWFNTQIRALSMTMMVTVALESMCITLFAVVEFRLGKPQGVRLVQDGLIVLAGAWLLGLTLALGLLRWPQSGRTGRPLLPVSGSGLGHCSTGDRLGCGCDGSIPERRRNLGPEPGGGFDLHAPSSSSDVSSGWPTNLPATDRRRSRGGSSDPSPRRPDRPDRLTRVFCLGARNGGMAWCRGRWRTRLPAGVPPPPQPE